jgi:RimJ/RimL family protein N-acetyltransferase
MPELEFRPIEAADFPLLAAWFEDAELRRWVEPPTQVWFAYITAGQDNRGWLVLEDGEPVGCVQLDIHLDQIGYFGFYTCPSLRRQGYGKRILQALIQFVDSEGRVKQLIGTAEPENIASIRCMQSAGFVLSDPEPDGEGFFHYIYLLSSDL